MVVNRYLNPRYHISTYRHISVVHRLGIDKIHVDLIICMKDYKPQSIPVKMETPGTLQKNIKPMGLWPSLLYFGLPSAIFCFFIYGMMQRLHQNGINDFTNFYVSMVTPLLLLLVASLIAYKAEGNIFSWAALSARFRLKKMNRTDWLYTLGLFLAMAVIYMALSFTSKWLIQFKLFAPPDFLLPAVDPRLEQPLLVKSFMGIPLQGQWWIAIVYFTALVFNIIGEEFWWRGYIMPRQELAFGKWTWVVHGVLWTSFHVFWKWNLIILLPTCLALSYVVYRRKNTWIGIITHMAFNSVPLIGLIIGIIG
jgi:membrane protease YdiL (CAAX protease family)